MSEATLINLGIGAGTIIFSVGGAWSLIRAGIKENTRRITKLEDGRGKIYDRINLVSTEVSDVAANVAEVSGKLDVLIDLKK